MTEQRYKFLRLVDEQIRSESGHMTWSLDEWKREEDAPVLCEHGFHCSQKIYDAFSYVHGEILALVECDGEVAVSRKGDKEAWQQMRLLKAWRWRKEDSVSLAIYSAELVIDLFEKRYPDDTRPRKAIEANRNWLNEPTEENRRAAADAADAAVDAAAAAAAADAADAAVDAAAAAAAARKAILDKIETWMQERMTSLVEYVPPVVAK